MFMKSVFSDLYLMVQLLRMEVFSYKQTFTKRLPVYILTTILIGIIVVAFTAARIATNDINQQRVNDTEQQLNEIRNQSQINIFLSIFRNNYYIALNFIAPIAGQIFFIAVMYSTAEIFAARSIQIGQNASISPYFVAFIYIFTLMFSPTVFFFGFLEFLGYALALVQSINLINSAIKSIRSKDLSMVYNELKFTILMVVIIAIVLLLAAYLESLLV